MVVAVTLAALAGALGFTATGRGMAGAFVAALRMPKPQRVNVNVPSFAGAGANRQLQNMIGAILSGTVNDSLAEAGQPAASALQAAALAGFAAHLPRARSDRPALEVTGARTMDLTVNRDQLRTILAEAGVSGAALPESLQGAHLTVRTPRAIRARYGNCPAPVDRTLQGQLVGAPPPATDNGDCIILAESPAATADVPAGLDMDQLTGIALELSGMSPAQAKLFPAVMDWRSSLLLSVPRFVRSCDPRELNGAHALLLNTAGRRGPTYALLWTKAGMVYALTGYGNPGDAVSLANSID